MFADKEYRFIQEFTSPSLGNVYKGRRAFLAPSVGNKFVAAGLAELVVVEKKEQVRNVGRANTSAGKGASSGHAK